MRLKRTAGFVPAAFTEILIVVALSAIFAAIFVPRFKETRRRASTHVCATALDSMAAGGEFGDTCPASGRFYVIEGQDAATSWCCPTPGDHALVAFCQTAAGPVLAAAHPAPTRLRWIVTGVLACAPLIVFVLFGILMIGSVIAEEIGKRRKPS